MRLLPPALFALYSVAFLILQATPAPVSSEIIRAFVMAFVGGLIVAAVISRLFSDRDFGAQIASTLILVFFGYGHASWLLRNRHIAGIDIGRDRFVVLALAAAHVVVIASIWRMRRHSKQLTRAMTVSSAALCALVALQLPMSGGRPSAQRPVTSFPASTTTPFRPNVYYILLDGYADAGTLRDSYGFDNTEFVEFLRRNGFWVGTDSHSNYAMTVLSLAATLNMTYFDHEMMQLSNNKADTSIPRQMIRDPLVPKTFRSLGYRLVHVRSGWDATDDARYADETINTGTTSAFVEAFALNSLLAVVVHQKPNLLGNQGDRVLKQFATLSSLSKQPGPFFLFNHIVSPHPPFVFGRSGERRVARSPENSGSGWEDKQAYLDQLIFVTGKVKDAVSEIIGNDPAAIVILQSDHGPVTERVWNASNRTFLKSRMGILNAIRASNIAGLSSEAPMTAVNTFRWLLSNQFNIETPLLPNRVFYSDYVSPLDLHDVTSTVQ